MSKRLKSGDIVKIIAGDEKGKSAKIVSVKGNKACLEGIGIVERHVRASYMSPKGGKKTIHLGIDMSNLSLEKPAEAPKKSAKKAKETK